MLGCALKLVELVWLPRQRMLAGLALVAALFASGCGASEGSNGSSGPSRRWVRSRSVSPLSVVEAPTPRLRTPGIATSGTYPQVRGGNVDLQAVNAALREVILADQHSFGPYARKTRKELEGPSGPSWAHTSPLLPGRYRTTVDRKLVSASAMVVSALLPATTEVFDGQPGGDGWQSMTVRVPSGNPVTISQLFADRSRGLRVLGGAWSDELRRRGFGKCLDFDVYVDVYPSAASASLACSPPELTL